MTDTVTHAIVTANPGWSLAIFIEGGKESNGREYPAEFALYEIIAWEIERTSGPFHQLAGRPGEIRVSREVTPITADGTNVDNTINLWALRRPDGIYVSGDGILGTEAEAIAEYLHWAKERRREQKSA